ncbi:hypothetical protein SASPL_150210 [Salvia splendens]|uniref:Reverse transcriptase Ty1/copia-type domain-containing protein n=1 Tax=Salvia splendens TaxID=180675 RepID=A0A8X8W6G2_SALSN|nr:hypothetical protein SASPL_150210 [Salvia splendens]
MGSYGETISNEQVVGKVLRSLNECFDYLVPAIEESKDLSTYTFDDLMSSLLAHETRVRKPCDKVEEKAFQVKGESSYSEKIGNSGGRYGRGGFRGRCHGNGRGRGRHDDGRQNKYNIQCHYCKKNGHKEFCWIKQKHDQKANSQKKWKRKTIYSWHTRIYMVMQMKECGSWTVGAQIICLGQGHCSKILIKKQKGEVRLGDDKQVSIEGRGTVAIKTVQERWIWNTDEKQPGAFFEFPDPRHEEPEENGSSDSSSSDSTPPDSPTQNSSNHTSPHNSASSSSISNSSTSSNTLSPTSNLPSGSSSDGTPPKHFRSLRNIYRTYLGLLSFFLGHEVKQSKDGIFVCQEKHATDLLKKFHMSNCEIAAIPMNVNEKLQLVDGTEHADGTMYRSLVGGLNYLTHTTPGIAFPVSVVLRYMHNPTKQHLGAARRILRYVAGTVKFGIWYTKVSDFKLAGYTDSDWAGCLDDRKSTSGNIFSLGFGAVTWSSKKQDTIAPSSSEAEYAAATSATRQALWLQKLLTDFPLDHNDATTADIFTKSLPQAKH